MRRKGKKISGLQGEMSLYQPCQNRGREAAG